MCSLRSMPNSVLFYIYASLFKHGPIWIITVNMCVCVYKRCLYYSCKYIYFYVYIHTHTHIHTLCHLVDLDMNFLQLPAFGYKIYQCCRSEGIRQCCTPKYRPGPYCSKWVELDFLKTNKNSNHDCNVHWKSFKARRICSPSLRGSWHHIDDNGMSLLVAHSLAGSGFGHSHPTASWPGNTSLSLSMRGSCMYLFYMSDKKFKRENVFKAGHVK